MIWTRPQRRDGGIHVRGNRRLELEIFGAYRMDQPQPEGMQHLPLDPLQCRVENGIPFGRMGPHIAATVNRLPQKRMAHGLAMDPDLMGATGLQVDLQQGRALIFLLDPP